MLVPLTLAGAAGGFVLTNVVEAFRAVAHEQRLELVSLGPLEADVRRYENAAYNAFHTNYQRELEQQGPELDRRLRALTAAMDEDDERQGLVAMRAELKAAAGLLGEKLAEPFPQRSLATGDPLAAFAVRLDRAVEELRLVQRFALEESDTEVGAADSLRQRLRVAFALLVALAFGAALLLARGLERRVLAPLRELEEASQLVGAGDLRHRLAFDRDDELGAAGAAFDGMVEQLEEGRHELQLSQHRLHESQKLEAVGQLAGGIAHDFNNLLLVIHGYTSLVAARLPAGDPRVADLGVVQDAADRAARLTRQLLTFSRREIVTPTIVDVNNSVTELQTMLRSLIPSTVAIELDLDPAAGTTEIDPVQLEQVVVNLALNARDAINGSRNGTIEISSRRVDVDDAFAQQHAGLEPGTYVRIGVHDNGHGMPSDVAERIFEPFFTTKPRGTGTGLGLAVTHGIVQKANGHVSVYSELGVGSTFNVYLPASAASADLAETPEESGPVLAPATVLVAEDEAPIRALIERILTEAGVTAVVASSAEEALLLAEGLSGRFDLLLSDLAMPGKSGTELADDLARAYGPSPVVFMSGYSDAAPIGASAFLQKPFTRVSLLRAITEQLPAA